MSYGGIFCYDLNVIAAVKSYFQKINTIRKDPNVNEKTYRTPLENLTNTIWGKDITVRQEASSDMGIPDFTVLNKSGHVIGYIECKTPGFDLINVLNAKNTREYIQLQKYFEQVRVILFTDYFNFCLLNRDEGKENITCLGEARCQDVKNPPSEDILRLLDLFMQALPVPVKSRDSFIRTLADKTRNLRDIILKNEGLSDTQALFCKSLYRDLSQKDFADALAQIFTFSLLFCRLTWHREVTRNDLKDMPKFIPVLKEIMGKFSLDKMPADSLYVIDSIIDTINIYDEELFFPKDKNYKDKKEDPFIYLYEHFLKEFDPDVRNARGVFYTPIQVVRYLIRSTDEILKDRLGTNLIDGHILDFATGTGTFLLSTIEYVYQDLMKQGNQGAWKSLVQDFILRRLYGFEYLIVPYVLAHFRVYEYLRECDYEYQDKDRLQLYLTNTLENGVPEPILMFPDLNEEADAARQVKNTQPILVVMGNPPYNAKSDPMNSKEWITELLKDYKEDTDAPLSGTEKGKLEDDYIKFIRFAQWKIDSQPKGLVSVIVNNSFLDGVSHRLMRKSLMSTFDEIYIFNLHGNGNKAEKTPDGEPDANVFPIQSAGVCMLLMAKTGKWGGVHYQDLYAPTAKEKLDYLQNTCWRADRDRWQELHSAAPWYWFIPRDNHKKYWHEFKGLKEIFSEYKTGVQFRKDKLLVHSTPDHVCEML